MAENTETRALAPIDEVRQSLAKLGPQFKLALPPHISVAKFVRVVQTAVAGNPDLVKCDRQSLYGAAMKCAQDGLLPDGREAALVKFSTKVNDRFVDLAQYMPMVSGILKKVRNSGELKTISAHVVYERDDFAYTLGDNESIRHVPPLIDDRGKPIACYAVAHTKDGGIYREIMSEAQVQAVRKVSRSGEKGPWSGPFADEMRRKTVLRRLSKRLPMSTDVEDIMGRDNDLYEPAQQAAEPPPGPPPASSEAEATTGRRSPGALSKVVQAGKGETIDVQATEVKGGAAAAGQGDDAPAADEVI